MKDEFKKEREEFEAWFPQQFKGGEKLLKKSRDHEYLDITVNTVWIGFVAGYNMK